MPAHDQAGQQSRGDALITSFSSELVMGLRWDPGPRRRDGDAEDLDALCVLYDAQRQLLEVVHPGQTRNASGGVIHSGDSRTGAGNWDDEQIFIFLDALPDSVASLAFIVASASERSLDEFSAAACHISERITERELLRTELAGLQGRSAHCVATLWRSATGWELVPGGQSADAGLSLARPSQIIARDVDT